MRFGAIAPSAEALQEQVLARRHDELTGLIAESDGCVELGLKASGGGFHLEGDCRRGLPGHAPPARQNPGCLVQQSYYDRLSLGEMIDTRLPASARPQAQRILARLGPLTEQYKENPLHLDRMVINGAFLVRQARQAEFDDAVRRLDEDFGDRLIVKYVGPVPPYNFVSLVIAWDQ